MEVAARELIPRAARRRARRCASPRSSTARRPGEDLGVETVVVPVDATSRVAVGARRAAAAAGAAPGAPAATSCTRSARPRRLRGRVRPRHDDPRPQLPDGPRRALRRARARDARARAARRAPRRTASIADSASTRDDLVDAAAARRPRRSTSSRSGSASPPTATPTPEPELRERARPRRPAGRALAVGEAPAQEPRAACSTRSRCIPAERRPVLVLPGYPTPARGRAARARGRARASTGDVRFLGWTSPARPRGPVRARRARSCSRRCYEGFGLPVLEAMARGVPVALLGPRVAARGRRRRRAAVRPGRPRRDRARRSSGCSPTAPRPSGCAPPGARSAARVHLGAGGRADARELRARARRAVARGDGVERAVERQPLARCARTSPRSTRAAPAPAAWTRTIASARSSGAAVAATKPLTPSSTSSAAALSGPRTSDAGVPSGGRLDDDQPVALAPRRQHAGRARAQRALDAPRASTKPGASTHAVDAVRGDRGRAPRRAPGRRRRSRRAARAARRGARATAGTTAGARFSGMWRPANTTSGSAGSGAGGARAARRTRPRSTVHLAAQPVGAQPRRVSSREAERALAAPAGTARWTGQPTRPPTPPRYSRQYVALHTSYQSTTRR